MHETEHTTTINYLDVDPLGYASPNGKISRVGKLENGEINADIDDSAEAFIKSGDALVEVHEHDDGCIDGRCTHSVYLATGDGDVADLQTPGKELYISEDGQFYFKESDSSNHERAKVAGGYITGQAIRLGIGKKGEAIDSDIAQLGLDYAEKGIVCGAHSGAHMAGEGTDCGANDKLKDILENAVAFQDDLKKTLTSLLGVLNLPLNEATFAQVIHNWESVTKDDAYFEGSTGKTRLNTVLATQGSVNEAAGTEKPEAVTKHLRGDHNESRIVINFVKGKTISQNAVKQHLIEAFDISTEEDEDKLPQAFVVDAWRVAELAEAAADDETQEAALYAGVLYQLATAVTLTDGTLKNLVVAES